MIPTLDTLQRAAQILQQIEALQNELAGLFAGGPRGAASPAPKRRGRPPGRPAAAAIAAPAAPAASAAAASKRRHRMSAEGRARIAAAAKARWAKFRAEKKKPTK
jgi:hypothetical protein